MTDTSDCAHLFFSPDNEPLCGKNCLAKITGRDNEAFAARGCGPSCPEYRARPVKCIAFRDCNQRTPGGVCLKGLYPTGTGHICIPWRDAR